MSAKGVISRELHESIRHILGRNVKISLKCPVRLETKPEKTENRVLAFSACRLFILTAKVPTKIEHTFHYLDLQAIESKKNNQLCLTVDNKIFTFFSFDPESEDVNHMISQLGTAVKSIFPQVPLEHVIRKLDVHPPTRLQAMLEYNHAIETKDTGPCGGYSTQYACMCDYHGLPYREEVAWDVDTIYLSHDSKELSLLDFDHLDGRDLMPIISALMFNTWFTKFRATGVKLISEALDVVLLVLRRSVALEEIYLDNTGLKWDFAYKLSLALIANPHTPLHTIDLSNNLIEDKGINSLCGIIAKITQGAGQLGGTVGRLQKGLIHLNLSRTGLTSKGINTLAHALSLNRAMPSTLTFLNLSDNLFKDDVNNLYNFLAQPNALTHLDLSGTECALDTVFGALLRGCTQKLAVLILSRNQFSAKKSKEVNVPPSFKAFFSSTVALKQLNMSGNKLPVEALKAMLLGLACNEIATDISLDLSNNELKSHGALVLESCLPGIRCLCSLDISDNGFDVDLANIVNAVAKNKSIKHLSLGRNFMNIKPKYMTRVMDSLVQLIQEEDTVLESLSLADSKLRGDACVVINALGSNQCLTAIDITGNYMGGAGAKTLAKALQINSKLRSILWDKNATPPQGFHDVAYALEKNFTLRYMPCPIFDATAAMKIAPEKTESALKRIEDCLHRNVSPKKYINGRQFRLQQGFLLSSAQQNVDRLMVHLQDSVNNLKRVTPEGATNDEIERVEGFLSDANNAKQLLTRLHEVVLLQEESGNAIEKRLQDFVKELLDTIENHLISTASCMLKCVEDQCPNIIGDDVRRDLEKLCQDRGVIPIDFVRHSLLEQTGTSIINKVSEVNLSVAAHVSDRILDEIIETLSRSHRELHDQVNQQRCTTPDVLRGGICVESGLRISHSGDSQLDRDSYSENSDSPLATPKLTNKRKSVHARKLRPQSVVDSVEGIAADDIPDLLPKDEESLPSLSPMSEKLEHLGKARPKRPKTRAPTRPAIQGKEVKDEPQDLGEGLENFFRQQRNSLSTPTLSPDSEDIRERAGSSSTSVSMLSGDIASSDYVVKVDKSPDNEKKERGFMKGISSLFSRISPDVSHIHKSRSYDLTDKGISSSPSPSHSSGKEPNKSTISIGDITLHSSSPHLGGRSQRDKESKEDSNESLIKPKGVDRFGPGSLHCSNPFLLAEMKSRQEKRTPSHHSSMTVEEKGLSSTSEGASILANVKLKPTGLSQTLISPTDTQQSNTEDSASQSSNSATVTSTPGSPLLDPGGRLTPNLKFKPPPPIAPKPRPKSVGGTAEMRLSGDFSNVNDGESPKAVSPIAESTQSNVSETDNDKEPPRAKSMCLLSEQSDIEFSNALLNGNLDQLNSMNGSKVNSCHLSSTSANISTPVSNEQNDENRDFVLDDVIHV
ncbi:F-actin-uncapping protein LRRC16A isoform X2 [Parasteatoda tepidariorum]|uniref:F-actin-uncapping protein LRRC16A isoform X2 n=1 Tax=Parasteatoda tepidariorum TaxID=114398 RepID=UPI001C72852C|nr:F-actin-uncapping protein LRRC16A isoform X1 [Parasteatoda tepidariorum]